MSDTTVRLWIIAATAALWMGMIAILKPVVTAAL